MITQKTWRLISLALLIIFALALRLHHLDYESLWIDEIRQVSYYPYPFSQIIHDAASQNQPPLDYWIGHVVHFFSNSDFALRLPSALFGVGIVIFVALLSAKVSSWPVGLGIGIISALLPFNLYFSQEARPYSIAIFFFLAVLWSLDALLVSTGKRILKGAVLLFFLSFFLYSRSLSPLVVTFTLGLIFIIWFIVLVIKEGLNFKGQQISVILGGFVCGLALLLYIPNFRIVLNQSGMGVYETLSMFGINSFVSGINNFDLFPIWQAFVVQTDPLRLSLLVLLLLSPCIAFQMKLWKKNSLWVISTALLPACSILNILVFQAMTGMPFRPPYAIYLLPLTLILGAVTFQGIWNLAGKIKQSGIIRLCLLVFFAVLISSAAMAALNFKADRKKSDWRGVCDYLSSGFGSEQILIFDSLLPYGRPTFYGFTRYYQKRSALFYMSQVPFLLPRLMDLGREPVFILFQQRAYYLTARSRYPLHFGHTYIDFGKIRRDPLFKVAEFDGFCVVKLKDKGDTFAGDAYKGIGKLLLHLPQDSSLVEMHLAAAGLARISGLSHWQGHFRQAEMLAGDQYRSRLIEIKNHITDIPIKK